MPIYDFKCKECGKVSEIIIRSTGVQAISCPGCGSNDMERLISSSFGLRQAARLPVQPAAAEQSVAKHRPATPARGATDIKGVTTCRNLSRSS